MVLFRAAIRRDSVSLLRLPFLSYVQILLCEISLIIIIIIITIVISSSSCCSFIPSYCRIFITLRWIYTIFINKYDFLNFLPISFFFFQNTLGRGTLQLL